MKTAGSILIGLAMLLAAVFAPNLDVQAAGTSLCIFAVGMALAALGGFREPRPVGALSWVGLIAAIWIAFLALRAPVADLGRADAILILGGIMACLWAGSLASKRAIAAGFVMLSLLAAVSLAIGVYQVTGDPDYHVLGGKRPTPDHASGFYGHYNYFANFLLGIFFPSLGMALLGRRRAAVRIGWLAVALVTFAGILLSQSRGALVGVAAGGAVFAVLALIDWRRRYNLSGLSVAVIAMVLLPTLAFGGLWIAKRTLADRNFDNLKALEHDSGRLEFAAMALEQASASPLTGSGSRSFAYHALEHWDPDELWVRSGDINFVHNEFLQAASDYGWPALALIVLLLGAVLFKGAVAVSVKPFDRGAPPADSALTAGALAGVSAMALQASFSFVFHLLPNMLLAGFLVGIVASQPWPLSKRKAQASRLPLAAVLSLLLSLSALLWFWRDAAAVTRLVGAGTPVERISRAVEVRPDFHLYRNLGDMHLSLTADSSDLSDVMASLDGAAAAYEAAAQRHPYEVETMVNLAKVLDRLGRFEEAEELYQKMIPVADPREGFYRARFYHGRHAYLRALRSLEQGDEEVSMKRLSEALERMDASWRLHRYSDGSFEGRLRASVNDLLARGHFTRGHKLYLEGREEWYARKPEKALGLLLRAREEMERSGALVPLQKTPELVGIHADVVSLIELLEGAGIVPDPGGE